MNGGAFSGLRLSAETAATAGVDQRLFAAPAAEQAPASDAQPPHLLAPRNPLPSRKGPIVRLNGKVVSGDLSPEEPKPEVPLDAARAERPLTEPATKSVAPFDINEKPWRKDSFLFTDSEFERLEDLKLELRRRFDLPATKNDVARAAFQGLFEDYARDPEKSRIVRHLKAKNR